MTKTAPVYPETRYMGSKEKLTAQIMATAAEFGRDVFVDVFSGSGVVAHTAKRHGYAVHANDYLRFCATYTKAMVENSSERLSDELVERLVAHPDPGDGFVEQTYTDIFYHRTDARAIDRIRTGIRELGLSEYEAAIAMSGLVRACIKKRPRGIFTYTGLRYDDGRRDLRLSIEEHFRIQVAKVNNAVFDNGQRSHSTNLDFRELEVPENAILYLDPPYYSPVSDNHYVRRYHFVEGLSREWQGVEMQPNTKTRKFANFPTPFSTQKGTLEALREILSTHPGNDVILSYSSNSLPTKEELFELFMEVGRTIRVTEVDHRYSFSTRETTTKNKVKEYLFTSPGS